MQTETTTSDSSHVADLLSAYIDGRVTPVERLTVETHVAGCIECQSQLRSLHATVAMLQGLPVMPAPRTFYIYPGMLPETRKALLPPLPRLVWVYGALRLAASVASLLLVMVIAVDALGPLGPRAAAPLQIQSADRGAAQGATSDLSPTKATLASAPLASPSPGIARETLAASATPVAPPAAATATSATAMAGLAPGAVAPTPAGLGAATPTPVPATVAKSGPEAPSPTSKSSADTAAPPITVATAAPSPAAAETSGYLPPSPQAPVPQASGSAQPNASATGAESLSPLRALEAALASVVVALLVLTLVARRAAGGKRS